MAQNKEKKEQKVFLKLEDIKYKHEYILNNLDAINILLDSSKYKNINYLKDDGTYYTEEDDKATAYARAVVSGQVMAGREVIQECMRHLKYLMRLEDDFVYDVDFQCKVLKFASILTSEQSDDSLQLAPFQEFIAGSLIGWRTNTEDYSKRFRNAVILLARQQGKTLLIAILVLYEILFGEVPHKNRQAYCAANSKDQANILYDKVIKFAEDLVQNGYDDVIERFSTKYNTMINKLDGSILKSLSSETGRLDGKSPNLSAIDECHEAKDGSMYNVLSSGRVSQNDSLIVLISTTGFNMNSWFYGRYTVALRELDGDIESHRTFNFICQQDSLDEADKPEYWIKSNPILGHPNKKIVKDRLDNMMDEYSIAKAQGGDAERNFLVKNLNFWSTTSEDSLLDIEKWDENEISEFNKYKKSCYLGIDLSTNYDLSAITTIYIDKKKGEATDMVVESHGFIPTEKPLEARSKKEGIDYIGFINEGVAYKTNNPQGYIDIDQIIEYLLHHVSSNELNVLGIYYDPAVSREFVSKLSRVNPKLHDKLIIFDQNSYSNYHTAVWAFKRDFVAGKVKHLPNSLLRTSIMNTKLTEKNGQSKPIKNKDLTNDNAVSMIMAYLGVVNYKEDSNEMKLKWLRENFTFS